MDDMHETPGGPGALLDTRRTPDSLIAAAKSGALTTDVLAALLTVETRPAFLARCAAIERQYTEACAAKVDPCLESGCSAVEDGEICLQPLLEAGPEYLRACGDAWATLFSDPANRADLRRP
jgi:hypothetical protein